jgi:hypothetical protein
MIPKYLYHATSKANWEKIKEQGLKPFFPAVYMTEDLKAAEFFKQTFHRGRDGVILKIDTSKLNKRKMGRNEELLCQILKTPDFYHYYGTIKPQLIERIETK